MIAGTMLAGPASATSPSAGGLSVTSVGSRAWTAGRAMPVRVVVRGSGNVLCDALFVSLAWTSPGKGSGYVSTTVPADLGAQVVTLALPARAMRTGTVSYTASAAQSCGLFDNRTTSTGHSGRSTTRVL